VATEVQILKPDGDSEHLVSSEYRDAVAFEVLGLDAVVIQLVDLEGLGSWPASLVLSVEGSLDNSFFGQLPGGAIPYSAFGIGAAISVTGLAYLRVIVSTVSASGHGNVGVRATGARSV
jgi:hypothetical protein